MRVLWDEPKRIANLVKHGMDFAALDEEFFGESAVYPVKRKSLDGDRDYGRWARRGGDLHSTRQGSHFGHLDAAGEPEGKET